ncbi:MAG: hypothetical protein M1840_007791 [Geoglossum simile]|nr:MAG: hypothetical protein M1840_007791 [Geoglossum simile]
MDRRTSSSRRSAQSPLIDSPVDYPQGLLRPSHLEGPDPSISTVSPFESPATPNFPTQGGLAPRPSSFPYGSENPASASDAQRRPVTRGKDSTAPSNPQRRTKNRWEDRDVPNNSHERPVTRGKDPVALSDPQGRAASLDGGPNAPPGSQRRSSTKERDAVGSSDPQRHPSMQERDPTASSDPQRRPSTKGRDPITSSDPHRRSSTKGKDSITSSDPRHHSSAKEKDTAASSDPQRRSSTRGNDRVTSNPQRRPSTNRGDRSLYDKPLPPDPPPAAPDAPRAPPPVSYRNPRASSGPSAGHQRNSRSFAERVQGVTARSSRQVPDDPNEHIDRQGSTRRHRSGSGSADTMPPAPEKQGEGRRSSSSANPSSAHHRSGSRTASSQDPATSALPPTRSGTRKGSTASNSAAPQQPIDWAPDNSPLQKLETTLRDIRREEKRADQEEEQILEREARGGRGGRRVSQSGAGAAPTAATGPSNLAEAGLVRNLSSKQKERLQRSTTVDSRKDHSKGQPPSTEAGRGFEYQEQQYVQDPLVLPESSVPARNTSFRNRSAARRTDDIASSTGEASRGSGPTTQGDRHHSRHHSHDVPHTRQHRVREKQQDQQVQHQSDRVRGPLAYDAKTAHDDETPRHFQSDDPVGPAIVDTGTGAKHTPSIKKSGSHKARDILGLHDERGKHHLLGAFHHGRRDRRSSESPELAHAAPTGLTEWREAGTASLSAADLSLDPEPVVSDKAWWEGGSTGKRRASTGTRKNASSTATWSDGQYESEDGMRSLIRLFGDYEFAHDLPEIERRIDPVVPPARHLIGFEGTSKNNARVQRRNKFKRRYQKLHSSRAGLLSPDISISRPHSLLSSALRTERKISHALRFHKRLTRSMRAIRVRKAPAPTIFRPPLFLKCGPLLRYRGLRFEPKPQKTQQDGAKAVREIWTGSVMIVTTDDESSYEITPTLRLFYQPVELSPPPPTHLDGESGELAPEYVDPIAGLPKVSRRGETLYVKPVDYLPEEKDLSTIETDDGLFTKKRIDTVTDGSADHRKQPAPKKKPYDGETVGKYREVKGIRLLAEQGVTFWRFNIEVELSETQSRIAYRINHGPAIGFWVPGRGQTMNIMFYSCNGFSVSINNRDQFSGPDPLWRDVLNTHQTKPFHVMIGGGDQLYNDSVMRQTTVFQEWLEIKNPLHKHSAAFTDDMKEELEIFYFERYAMWFSQGLFGMANSQIPMVNIWDDHDIIDGYGSYPHHLMSSPVFMGLGAVAFKYYMLFQHQSIVDEGEEHEPSWVLGASPGPYITELSRSIFMSLGRKVAFLGLDCRTERTRGQIVCEESYDRIFNRCYSEIVKGETKHLIVLLGVPIAYPRLVWLETILTSRLMDPVKALGRAGLFGGLINKFDGGVEILDDLDDHWTAKNHKDERNWFIEELQELAAEKSVRVTILGFALSSNLNIGVRAKIIFSGDVHLAAIGRFYSNPKLGIPKDCDHRYMPNIISSAIVNTPPTEIMGDILNRRNKVHHLDEDTDEDMIPIFTHDVDGKPRNNKRLLPRRNWCSIAPYEPSDTPPLTPEVETKQLPRQQLGIKLTRTLSLSRQNPLPYILRRNSRQGGQNSGNGIKNRQVSESTSAIPHRPSSMSDGYFPPQPLASPDTGVSAPAYPQGIGPPNGGLKRTLTKSRGAVKGAVISMDDGLDIILNCEVSQKDPAGITSPYRLLLPALYYQGEGDVNNLNFKGRRWSIWGRKTG